MIPMPTAGTAELLREAASFNTKIAAAVEKLGKVKDEDVRIATTPKDEVFTTDKVTLYRYRPLAERKLTTPVLIVYSLIGRYTMACTMCTTILTAAGGAPQFSHLALYKPEGFAYAHPMEVCMYASTLGLRTRVCSASEGMCGDPPIHDLKPDIALRQPALHEATYLCNARCNGNGEEGHTAHRLQIGRLPPILVCEPGPGNTPVCTCTTHAFGHYAICKPIRVRLIAAGHLPSLHTRMTTRGFRPALRLGSGRTG